MAVDSDPTRKVGVLGDDKPALDAAMPALYHELRRIAKDYLSHERPGHTLQPTALVHEAYLRLVQQHKIDWSSRAQVLGVAARMMRRILVNYAVARSAQKRDAALRVTAGEADLADMRDLELEDLDSALNRLEEIDPRQASIVELRFFSGLTIEETASVVNVSPETVKREWRTARLWLARELDRPKANPPQPA
ncbi:MAG: sigma-70 family RNA polymerase sigma factor [Acidobacteriaceae bacterium]|nr:sigma-70 family RNA polymerase sigma factor [Acidobacteriaceae bacterium]MBV9778457.1 sigma-70 family RNA polymerase sigma factor [Acidobacteriaceae bacterium]